MIKYCFVLDKKTGLVQLGAGCTDEYYKEIGMEQRDVKQSDIDNAWYLTPQCPMKSEEDKYKEREEYFYHSFFSTSLGWIRRGVTLKTNTKVDFLTDLLPTIAMGANMGQKVKVIAYNKPPFDKDVEDWTKYQHVEEVTPQFIQECFNQLQEDFGIINK